MAKKSEKVVRTFTEVVEEIAQKSKLVLDLNKISDEAKKRNTLKNLLRSYEDTQKIRIAMGNRIFSTVSIGLGIPSGSKLVGPVKELMDMIQDEFKLITDAIVAHMKKPPEINTFTQSLEGVVELAKVRKNSLETVINASGNSIVNNTLIYSLCQQYDNMKKQEKQIEMEIAMFLEGFPIYTEFLQYVRGCGPMLSAHICANLDIWKARYPSSFWKFCGLDVVPETNTARSRRAEHLIDREYIDAAGNVATKKSITYDPNMKRFILGVASGVFIKSRSPYCIEFYNYLGRINQMEEHKEKTPAHKVRMALRRMMKIFLVDVHAVWCSLVGKPHIEYCATKLNRPHTKPFIRDLILKQAAVDPKNKLSMDDVSNVLMDPEGFWAIQEIKAKKNKKDEDDAINFDGEDE